MNATATAQQVDLLAPSLEPQPAQPLVAQPIAGAPINAEPGSPDYLIALAAQLGDKDLDRWERLLKMRAEAKAEQARLAYRRDFAAFKGENIVIPKGRFVDRGKAGSFWQAEYDDVCTRLAPALSKHGFGFRHDQVFGSRKWTGQVSEGGPVVEQDVPWVYVTCYLEHRDGHAESLGLEGPPGDATANTPVQNMQVTASYLKRQSLLAITGTATAGEDDEAAMKRRAEQREKDDASADEALLDEGRAEAMKGMKALTEWWGKTLSAAQRARLSKEFPGLRVAAQKADQGGHRG